jgi:hypothetical protein
VSSFANAFGLPPSTPESTEARCQSVAARANERAATIARMAAT